MSDAMKKYLSAMEFHTNTFELLMKRHPEKRGWWSSLYDCELQAVIMVATYDDAITIEQLEELHDRRAALKNDHDII